MIEVKDLKYTYPGGKAIAFNDFQVKRGEHCLLLGESGCGKTTLLHLIGGLLRNTDGLVRVNGSELRQMSESELDRFRGQHIGFVFQRNHLVSSLTVEQNLQLAPYFSGKTDAQNPLDVLSKLNLRELAHATVSTLSQGQAQRVAIARAVMNNPELILADEPTSALDDKNCDAVIDLMLQVAEASRCTLLIATHDSRLKSKIAKQIHLR